MKKLFFICLMFGAVWSGFSQTATTSEVVEPVVFQEKIQQKVQLVDVRTPKEFEAGHIERAENVDILSEGFKENMEKFNKEQPIYIYCRSGKRSAKAASILSEMGFEQIIDLKGGYNAWAEFEKE